MVEVLRSVGHLIIYDVGVFFSLPILVQNSGNT